MIFKVLSIKDIIDSVGFFIKDIVNGFSDFFISIYNFDLTGPQMTSFISGLFIFGIVLYLYYLFFKFIVFLWDLLIDLISKYDLRSNEYKFNRDDDKTSKLLSHLQEEWKIYLSIYIFLTMVTVNLI